MRRGVTQSRVCRGIVLAGWMVIVGCTMLAPTEHEPVRTFILTGTESGEESRPGTSSSLKSENTATVLVSIPEARPGYDTARMIYVSRDYELRSFAFNQWVDTPARMLHPLIVQALEGSGRWQVVQSPSPVRGDYRVDVRNLLLQQEFLQIPSRVQLQARVQLVDLSAQRIHGTHEFTVVQDAPSDDPYGGVIAANRAGGIFLRQLREWLETCLSESGKEGC